MSSANDIGKIMQRTKRYWYEDGFQDIGMGGWMLMLGIFFLAEALTPPGSPLWLLWDIGMPLVLIGGGLVVGWVINQLKAHVTYPRTGYVTYERQRKGLSQTFRIVAVMLVSAAVAAAIVLVQKQWLNLTVILGFVFAATFGFLGYRFGLRRYVLLAVWGLVLGIALAPQSLTLEQGSAIFFAGIGLAMIFAGWLTWQQYNRNAPPPNEANDATQS